MATDKPAFFAEARRSFHAALLEKVLRANEDGIPSNADGANGVSVTIAKGILTVTLPKTAEAQKPEKKIAIKAA